MACHASTRLRGTSPEEVSPNLAPACQFVPWRPYMITGFRGERDRDQDRSGAFPGRKPPALLSTCRVRPVMIGPIRRTLGSETVMIPRRILPWVVALLMISKGPCVKASDED